MKIENKQQASLQYYTLFFLVFLGVFVIFSIFLFPRVTSTLFRMKRIASWNAFKASLLQQKKIDGQVYWELREFYNEGNFSFNKEGLSEDQIKQQFQLLAINAPKDTSLLPFLRYNSTKFTSLDSLTSQASIDAILNTNPRLFHSDIIYNKHLLISETPTDAYIVFLTPISEMKKANGFFDYKDDKINAMLKGKNWLNISHISLR